MRTTNAIFRSLFVFLLCFAAAGCASTGVRRGGQEPVAFVSVENHNFNDVNVYAYPQTGIRRRLGTVTGASAVTFRLPREVVFSGMVRIVAVPIGGFGRAVTEQISVNRGDTIVFNVEQNLALSSVIIR